MNILLISTCKEKLNEYEFVTPIVEIIKSFEYDIINYKNLETGNISIYDKIIICGTSLQDNDYLNYLEREAKKAKISPEAIFHDVVMSHLGCFYPSPLAFNHTFLSSAKNLCLI